MKSETQTEAVVQSDQAGVHSQLSDVVARHLHRPWAKPIPRHTQDIAEPLIEQLRCCGRPIVLDSFCGTGYSTGRLAAQYPQAYVVGIDKSAHRLSKHQPTTAQNYQLIRADCYVLWRLLAEAGIDLIAHHMLYPNPWPKAAHLKRRIHGHPSFPWLKQLGGRIEVRSNWPIYIEEFAAAAKLIGLIGRVEALEVADAMTLFEQKYCDRGQALWRFTGNFSD